MPTISDNAICIRRWDFSETSQTVLLFCREIGLLRGLAKGAKRPKHPYSGGFDILTRGQVVAIVKPSTEFANVIQWHLEQVYERCRRDINVNQICLYMIDLLQHAMTDHDPHEGAFRLLTKLLDGIESGGAADLALLRWQMGLLDECGYRPELMRDAETGQALAKNTTALAFSSRHGGVVTNNGRDDRWRVRRETIEVLQKIQSGDVDVDDDAEVIRRANGLLAVHWREVLHRQLATMAILFPDLAHSPVQPRRKV